MKFYNITRFERGLQTNKFNNVAAENASDAIDQFASKRDYGTIFWIAEEIHQKLVQKTVDKK